MYLHTIGQSRSHKGGARKEKAGIFINILIIIIVVKGQNCKSNKKLEKNHFLLLKINNSKFAFYSKLTYEIFSSCSF